MAKPGYADDGRPLNITDEFRNMSIDDIKKTILERSLPYVIMALNVKDCHNIGNMIRTANLCGARKFIIFGRRKYDARGSVGAQNYIELERIDAIRNADKRNFDNELTQDDMNTIIDEDIFVEYMNTNNYLPIFIEQDSYNSKIMNDINIESALSYSVMKNKTPCFILGNEGFGIPKNILDTRDKFDCTFTFELKQMGSIRSHNVANCCAIVCYKIMENFTHGNNRYIPK